METPGALPPLPCCLQFGNWGLWESQLWDALASTQITLAREGWVGEGRMEFELLFHTNPSQLGLPREM